MTTYINDSVIVELHTLIKKLTIRIENLETITIGLSSDIEKLNKRLGSMSDNINQNPGNIFVGGSCCDD